MEPAKLKLNEEDNINTHDAINDDDDEDNSTSVQSSPNKSNSRSPVSNGNLEREKSLGLIEEQNLQDTEITDFNENSNEDEEDYTSMFYILKNLAPNFGSAFFYYIIGFLETHFIGQQKDVELLDGIGLALTYTTLLFYNQGLGISEALAVLCSKCNGSKNYKMINIYTKQARFLTFIYSLLYFIINLTVLDKLLYFLAPNAAVINISRTYILWTMPSLLLELLFEVTAKFGESQLTYKPVIFGLISALIVNPVLCYFMLSYFKLGVWGCIITTNVTSVVKILVITFTLNFLVKRSEEEKESSGIFDFKDFFKDFKKNVIIVITCVWCTFMGSGGQAITGFIAVQLGVIEYAKYIVLMNMTNIFVILQYSLYNTCCILVGNLVGINKPKEIKILMRNFFIITTVITSMTVLMINVLHGPITFFFSELDDIQGDSILFEIVILTVGEMLNCYQQVSNGLVIGLEKIKRASLVAFICYFFILPSLSYLFGIYFDFGLMGIMFAFLTCHVFGSATLGVIIWFLDLQKCCIEYKITSQLELEVEEKKLELGEGDLNNKDDDAKSMNSVTNISNLDSNAINIDSKDKKANMLAQLI